MSLVNGRQQPGCTGIRYLTKYSSLGVTVRSHPKLLLGWIESDIVQWFQEIQMKLVEVPMNSVSWEARRCFTA